MTSALLWLFARLVPQRVRRRWLEEWRAELRHGPGSMILGALPDAWTMRRLQKRPLPASAASRPFHAIDQDVRYAIRGLLASPAFALAVVLSLCVGIGGNIVAFSFVNAAVFRPFPAVHAQHELVRIDVSARDERGMFRALPNTDVSLASLRRHFTTVTSLSAHHETDLVISVAGRPFTGPGALVSGNYFDVLGIQPAAGHFFSVNADSPAAEPTAVISFAAWQRLFGGASSAVGSRMTVNATVVQIVGVAPEDFIGVRKSDEAIDVWIPFGLAELTLRDPAGRPVTVENAPTADFDYVGRRRQGITIEHVQAEASVLASRLQIDAPAGTTYVADANRVWMNDPAESAPAVAAFMIIPLLVLAIACVNAANLLLARAARHAHDWTVRVALGASRWRVVRQVLTEATILSFASAALGLLVAGWAIEIIAREIPVPLPVDSRVTAFTVAIALTAAAASSLGPALGVVSRAAKQTVTGTAAAAKRGSRVRFALVALQAALSLGLLTTGAQFTNTVFADSPYVAPIPAPERLVLASFDLDPLRMAPTEAQVFYQRLAERARLIPGVSDAGLSSGGLITGATHRRSRVRIWTSGSPPEGNGGFTPVLVSPGALEAIGVPLLAGSYFAEADRDRLRHVIVNEPFARKFFQGAALGRTLRVAMISPAGQSEEVTVIGIAGGIMKRADSEPPILYHPTGLGDLPARMLYLRLDDSGRFAAAALHDAVHEVDARVPVNTLTTLADDRGGRHREKKLLARGAAVLGMLALVLAAGGLYGVVSYVVSLRRQEVGIRLALGAEARSIVVMIVRQALTPAAIGAAAGLLGSAVVNKIVQSGLYGASPMSAVAFGGSTALLFSVLSVAAVVPASRAARVNPVDTLRSE